MTKITFEAFERERHPNHMWYVDNAQLRRHEHSHGLIPYKVCLVEVCGFQFIFHSVMQIELCLEYYLNEHQPSSRLPVYTENLGGDHHEMQRWYEKLPLRLLEKSKRPKVVKALTNAITEYAKYPGAITNTNRPTLWNWSGKNS
ncbi:MAG: hypothetical protein P4L91_13935 [Burkholderiaceae bacterium]|nr:hypothetical protein [Burkholderiaceae bacterium]